MAEPTKEPALDFNALVLSLGSSAIVHLGEAPDPTSGQKREQPDFQMAQQSIATARCVSNSETRDRILI